MKRRKVPLKELPAARAGLSQRWRTNRLVQTATAPCSTGAEEEGVETAGHWGIARGEWKYGVEWGGWGMGVK